MSNTEINTINAIAGYVPNYFQSLYLKDKKNCEKQLTEIFNELFQGIDWHFASQIGCIKNKNEIKIPLDELSYPIALKEVQICPELQRIFYKFECLTWDEYSLRYLCLCSATVYTPLINLFEINKKLFYLLNHYFSIKYNECDPKYYHTGFHVDYMLTKLNHYVYNLSEYDYRLLYLTIIFHDALYKAGNDNETVAINTVEKVLEQNKLVTYNEFKNIKQLINSTRIGTDINTLKSIHLADILHDLDYLSFSESNYVTNSEHIWNECASILKYNKDLFKMNRANFLSDLLDNINGNLFLTSYFKQYNKQAIININNELHSLFEYIVWKEKSDKQSYERAKQLYKK